MQEGERKGGRVATNLERLQAAGIATKTPLREPYSSVVKELPAQEFFAII